MTQIQVRRDTAANWASSNPVLGLGEPGYDSTNKHHFVGDGSTAWATLPYRAAPLWTPPPTSGWSTTTLGGATVAASGRDRLFTVPDTTGTNARVEYRTLSPTTNYTFTVYIEHTIYPSTGSLSGIYLRQSSDGKMVQFGPERDSTGFAVQTWKMTNATTYSTQYGVTWRPNTDLIVIPNWYRFRDDSTTRYAEYSYNGLDWITVHSVGRTDFLTADQVGWGADVDNANNTCLYRLKSWAVA